MDLPDGWAWPKANVVGARDWASRVALITPNGRFVMRRGPSDDDGYRVQPHNDNYWIDCPTLADAIRAYERKD